MVGENILGKFIQRHREEKCQGVNMGSHSHPLCGKEIQEERLIKATRVSNAGLRHTWTMNPRGTREQQKVLARASFAPWTVHPGPL